MDRTVLSANHPHYYAHIFILGHAFTALPATRRKAPPPFQPLRRSSQCTMVLLMQPSCASAPRLKLPHSALVFGACFISEHDGARAAAHNAPRQHGFLVNIASTQVLFNVFFNLKLRLIKPLLGPPRMTEMFFVGASRA